MIPQLHHRLQGLVALVAVVVVAACGGSGAVGSGGTGSQPSVSSGTVTGFGSIIVDGVRFDDSKAAVQLERIPGQLETAEVKIGHRVDVDAEVDGVAQAVRVEAEVIGPVSVLSAGGMTVLGQSILANADVASGPVTQFNGGYTGLADVAVGDIVEVHGIRKGTGAAATIQATRIEKLPAAPPYLRVAGLVSDLATASGSIRFTLGGLTIDASTAAVVPAGRSLENGRSVVVLGLASDLQAASGVLVAKQVRIRERSQGTPPAYVGGAVSALNAAAGTFNVDGVVVRYGAATLEPAGRSLANGQYVQARGAFESDGSLVAASVKIRDGSQGVEAELKGTILGLNLALKTFTVRDVKVDANGAAFENCPTPLVDGLFVEIEGSLGATGVVAKKVHCDDAPPSGATVGREGTASAVNAAAKSFTLTTQGGTVLSVTWTDLTYFRSLTPATLEGKKVEVQGVLTGTTLAATKVAKED